ncbi:hypothetical protein AB6A40_009269 [Gnathostoma spinigerum]|uniref:Uncharacterized protein n=1 Tax=Gnathostoma spinigerum TaxID=75299 RepID=A0ABD6F1B3_9BILA
MLLVRILIPSSNAIFSDICFSSKNKSCSHVCRLLYFAPQYLTDLSEVEYYFLGKSIGVNDRELLLTSLTSSDMDTLYGLSVIRRSVFWAVSERPWRWSAGRV